jgi:molybdenum-dependent DNA-binding transcriptional regulator ModE
VDGTKVMAHASKHAAVSYQHAGKTIEQLDLEVKELLVKAELWRIHHGGNHEE